MFFEGGKSFPLLFGFALLLLLCCSRRSRLLDGARRREGDKQGEKEKESLLSRKANDEGKAV
jgi:hypothetical protein